MGAGGILKDQNRYVNPRHRADNCGILLDMPNVLVRALNGLSGTRRSVDTITPRRTFDDVILPPATRRALDQALVHVTRHDLIFHRWGLGQRHPTGLSLAFNFAGPPGTGKTICAEAIASASSNSRTAFSSRARRKTAATFLGVSPAHIDSSSA